MKYSVNLVRGLRRREARARLVRTQVVLLSIVCMAVLVLSVGYSVQKIMLMKQTIEEEKVKLARIEAEYRQYKATKMIVDKADIELLDQLHNGRIFWTRKLAAMALHLPDNYWITDFGYRAKMYDVKGHGYITPKQEQLITIDDYLNLLRADENFADVFKEVYFNSTVRSDEGSRERVTFDFTSIGSKGGRQ